MGYKLGAGRGRGFDASSKYVINIRQTQQNASCAHSSTVRSDHHRRRRNNTAVVELRTRATMFKFWKPYITDFPLKKPNGRHMQMHTLWLLTVI